MTLDFSHPETLGIMKVKPPHPRIQASNGRFKSLVAHRNSKSWSRGHEVSHFRVMDSVLEMNRPSSNEWKTERFEFYQIRNTDPRLLQSRCIAFMFVCLSLEGNAASHFGKSAWNPTSTKQMYRDNKWTKFETMTQNLPPRERNCCRAFINSQESSHIHQTNNGSGLVQLGGSAVGHFMVMDSVLEMDQLLVQQLTKQPNGNEIWILPSLKHWPETAPIESQCC